MICFPAIPVKQNIGTFYIGVVSAKDLISVCQFDYRRMTLNNGYVDFLGIQRQVSIKRAAEIGKYLKTIDACFPTSIVISVDERCARIVGGEHGANVIISAYEDGSDPSLSIGLGESALIIDGQHRLWALKEAGILDFDLPVSVFIGADDATEAEIFSTVNLAQTKVNKSLVYDLFSISRSRSPEKSCHEITVALDRIAASPFYGRIKRLGVATEGRFGETLSQATIVKGILPLVSNDPLMDRDRGKRVAYWDEQKPGDFSKRIFYPFFRTNEDAKILEIIINFFNAVRTRWPSAWSKTGDGFILNRTNGYNALIRFMRDCYLYYTNEPNIIAEKDFGEILDRIALNDSDFTIQRYVPGTGGASRLYRDLLELSGVAGPKLL